MKIEDKPPQDQAAVEKLKAVMDFGVLYVENRGEFLRSQGHHTDYVLTWKKLMESSLDASNSAPTQEKKLNFRN